MTRVPFSITASTSSGSTPGSATNISTSRSVSSTSIGGSQLASREPALDCRLKNCRCSRSARASESIASDNIQLTGSLVGICCLACAEILEWWDCSTLAASGQPGVNANEDDAAVNLTVHAVD